MAKNHTIIRKAGDRLKLSGDFDGENLPPGADWTGATATLKIVAHDVIMGESSEELDADEVEREGDPVTITVDGDTIEYDYDGDPVEFAGKYRYEIAVTFAGAAHPVTWPNQFQAHFLKVVERA